jgi:hypothetical protein
MLFATRELPTPIVEYRKPSWIVEKDGRVVQVDPYGNKRSVCTLR